MNSTPKQYIKQDEHTMHYRSSSDFRGKALSERESSEIRDIVQLRINYLLVLIEENARAAAAEAGKEPFANMFRQRGDQKVEHHVIHLAEREITQLTRTLIWLDSERAGLCTSCAAAIPTERIKAMPSNRICDECSQQQNGDS